MHNDQLGRLIDEEGERDAIHIAIAPVTAYETLKPGQRICISRKNFAVADDLEPIGIVDPFLTEDVQKGESFYMCLFPNTITSLKHKWSHPSFEGVDVECEDKEIIAGVPVLRCESCGGDYQRTPEGKIECSDVLHVLCRDNSKLWLENFAEEMDLTLEGLIDVAEGWVKHGDYKCYRYDTPGNAWGNREEMWKHLRNICDDLEIPENEDGMPFTCSC